MVKTKKSSLRKVIPLTLSLMLAGCSMPSYFKDKFSQEGKIARQYWELKQFEVPGIEKIDKIGVNHPEHLLIHIRQRHFPLIGTPNFSELTKIKQSQDDIYECLIYFMEDNGLKRFYREGFYPGGLATSQNTLCSGDRLNLERGLEFLPGEDMQKYDEARSLFLHGDMTLRELITSRKDFIKESLYKEILASFDNPIKEKVFENRENALLEIISKRKDRFAVTVYGGSHDFTNNVLEWNKARPKDRFSLVVLTPRNF